VTPNRRPLKSRQTAWANTLSRALAARRVTPNSISVAGMVFASLGGVCYGAILWFPMAGPSLLEAPHVVHSAASGSVAYSAAFLFHWTPTLLLLGGVLGAQLRLVCNLLDGMVAVEGGLKGKAGDLFNEAPDRYADLVLLVTAGLAAGSGWLGWMAGAGAISTAYVRGFGASLGQGQDFCGPCAKQHRMFLLTVGSLAAILWPPALLWSLWVIGIGSFVTALRRIMRLYAKLP